MNQRSGRLREVHLADPEPSLPAVLDAVPRPLVVLEADGRVLAANRCWREGAAPWDPTAAVSPGDDFAALCDMVAAGVGDQARTAARVAEGTRQVLAGRVERCEVPYRLGRDSAGWLLVVISRIPNGAVVARVDPEGPDGPDAAVELTFHDRATGLPNRSLVLDRIKMALIRAERSDSWPAVLLVELAGLAALEGQLGPEERDRAVAEVGRRLVGALREGDTCGRWDEHELVLLAEMTDPSALTGLVGRVQASLALPMVVAGRSAPVEANIGVVLAHGSERVHQLLQLVEQTRREAARTGGVSVTHSLGN